MRYIDAALSQQRLKYKPNLVLDDLIESICLLQEEGFVISFVHRSFQEYFCALFLSQAPTGLIEQFLESENVRMSDDVILMLFGMNEERFVDEWARDFVVNLLKRLSAASCERDVALFLECCQHYLVDVSDGSALIVYENETPIQRGMGILHKVYSKQFRNIGSDEASGDGKEWTRGILQAGADLERSGKAQFLGFCAALNEYREKDHVFSFEAAIVLDQECGDFVRAMGIESTTEEVKALERIRRIHASQAKADNAFLKQVFG